MGKKEAVSPLAGKGAAQGRRPIATERRKKKKKRSGRS